MAMIYDYAHPCPQCGSAWKAQAQPVIGRAQFWVPAGSGACINPRCSMSPREVAAFRVQRRQHGWDPSLPEAG